MSNFGFTDLRLVNPYDKAFREAKSAVRAGYILESARVFANVAQAIADAELAVGTTALGHRDLHAPLYRLETGAALIGREGQAFRTALLFGSEKFGLSNEAMSHCHWLLRIPTRSEHGSMNLGQAVALCLYELQRSSEAANAPAFSPPAPLTGESQERLLRLLSECLEIAGYTQPSTQASSELKMRRLLLRLGIPAADAETWLGIFRQILWKLKQS